MALYRRNNIWYADFYKNGRRMQVSTGMANKREAEKFLAARVSEPEQGDDAKPVRISLAEFCERYMDYAKTNKRSWLRDEQMIKHLNAFFHPALLTDIGPLRVEQYKLHRSKAGAPATVNREIALLKRLFNLADTWGLFHGRNPVKGVRFLRENNIKLRTLSEEEEVRLMACCPGYLKDMIVFSIHTGLRSGDIFRLEWEGIELDEQRMRVPIRKTAELLDLPLNDAALAVLERWAAIRNGKYVFYNQLTGDRFHDVRGCLKKALAEAGLSGITWHTFRHTFASRLIRNGADIVTVKELMGHACIDVTMRYAHTNHDAKREALRSLSDKTVTRRVAVKK